MLVLIDNYDSFVYNLGRYFQRLGVEIEVHRNDAIDVEQIRRRQPEAIVLSPGPCTPREAGCSLEVIRQLYREIPMFGVCLGHQAIVEALAGRVVRAMEPVHGRATTIQHDGQGIFARLPDGFQVGRYHSLIAERDSLPTELEVSATTDDGVIMAVRHRCLPVVGVQFHPESILTEFGYEMLAKFCQLAGIRVGNVLPRTAQELPPVLTPKALPNRPVTF